MTRSSSYLPPGREEEEARRKSAKALWAWAFAHLSTVRPTIRADAEEAIDPLALIGFSHSHHNVDFFEPMEPETCLGVMCPKRSDECDGCEVMEASTEFPATSDAPVSPISHEEATRLFGSLYDRLYSPPPRIRRARVKIPFVPRQAKLKL